MSIYVAGGVYNEEFLLVKPLGKKNEMPYTSSNSDGMLRRSTQHHSHFYRLEGKTLFLEHTSWEAIAGGVQVLPYVDLLQSQIDEIEESFKTCDYK